MLPRIHLRDFGAEKENVRGPEDPNQENDERAGSAVTRSDRALAEVQTESELGPRLARVWRR